MRKKIIATNKKSNFNYFIEDEIEAGIVLLGSEIKSLRVGNVSIGESYVRIAANELFLHNCHISTYENANRFNHDPLRARKLLCHKKQIKKLIGKIKIAGYSIIPISMYFNKDNRAKIKIGVAKGKKLHDKRQDIKTKEWNRNKDRLLKGKSYS